MTVGGGVGVGVGVKVMIGVGVGVGVKVMIGVGVGVGVGPLTFTSVSVDPLDWQVRPSDKSAVPQTAVDPEAIPVVVVEYGEFGSEVGLTDAIAALYEPKRIREMVEDPKPEVTLADTLAVWPIFRLSTAGKVVTEHGPGVGVGVGVRVGVGVGDGEAMVVMFWTSWHELISHH